MTALGDFLAQVVPGLVRVARRPGLLLLRAAGLTVGSFAALGIVRAWTAIGWTAWVPLALAALLALPVVVLAQRRARLQATTEGLDPHRTIEVTSPSGRVGAGGDPGTPRGARPSGDARPSSAQAELDSLDAAVREGALRTARYFPRIEAAQRAGLLAAGGPVNAPYLRDDLRVTFVALVGTLAAVPLGALGAIVTAVLLLSR